MVWTNLPSLNPRQPAWVAQFGAERLVCPLRCEPVAWSSFCSLDLAVDSGVYFALIPYDEYSVVSSPWQPIVYRLAEWQEINTTTGAVVTRTDHRANGKVEIPWDGELFVPAMADRDGHLQMMMSDEDYLELAGLVLEDIFAGRYYQLNLLRYFRLHMQREDLLARLACSAAPYKLWLQQGPVQVASFSPERFLSAERQDDGYWSAKTFPIKGTVVADDPNRLADSAKDMAELSMIIDLMRNDMGEVACDQSVRVSHAPIERDFGYVRHLVGEVSATLPRDLVLDDLFRALLPAGSITGAPKREVMKAIRWYEQRARGYMMGNALYLDLERGIMDSNVLIRTAQGTGNGYEFAAGSGIVVKSTPEHEMAEIAAKCRALEFGQETIWNSKVVPFTSDATSGTWDDLPR